MNKVLITGCSGFLGTIMTSYLLEKGYECVGIDLVKTAIPEQRNYTFCQGDIRDLDFMEKIFSEHHFEAVFHFAAMLAHERKMIKDLWSSNVDGTRNIIKLCEKYGVGKIVFTSSNCLWGHSFDYEVTEEEAPCPIEIYGKSKVEGERILQTCSDKVKPVIIRCPTIMDEGRLGLLAILYEFMDENKRLWLVGNGENRYQFIYAKDLCRACELAMDYDGSGVFNIGSDNVMSFNYKYQYVVDHSDSTSKLGHFPAGFAKAMMKLCYFLGISPLGPYQYNMISSSFIFDTRKIKRELNWCPTLKDEEMLLKSYEYFHRNKKEIRGRKEEVSAHSREADMGLAIRILKFFS